MELLKQPFMNEEVKLVEPWWEEMRNPITGLKTGSHETRGLKNHVSDEIRYYNTLPTLDKNI